MGIEDLPTFRVDLSPRYQEEDRTPTAEDLKTPDAYGKWLLDRYATAESGSKRPSIVDSTAYPESSIGIEEVK